VPAPKKKQGPKLRLRDRLRHSINENKATYSVGALIGAIAILWPIFSAVAPWIEKIDHRYEKRSAAKAAIDELKREAAQHEKVDRRSDAWLGVGQSRIEVLILRNRVNECNVMRQQKRALTGLEISVCQQYDDELRQGQLRLERAQIDAKALSQ
jgi:hypothetical protein